MRANHGVDDRGVSPVIGVILMVAITVLLAAVVGTFVMNMDMPENQPPSTSWDISAQSDAVVIEHDGGEAAEAGTLVALVSYTGSEERYAFADGSSAYGSTSSISATDSWAIYFGSGSPPVSNYFDASSSHSFSDVEEVKLIWKSPTSSQTQPLTTWEP